MVACDRHSKRQGRARVHGVAPERYARAESNVVHAGRFRTSRTPLNRCAIDEVNHWSASPAVLDRTVPDHRSLMPFQNTRHSCILSTHDSHKRLRALNAYRTALHPHCSFRNRLVGENPPPIKKKQAAAKATAQIPPMGVPTQLAISRSSPITVLL